MKPKIDNQFPIVENIANRWSGRAFSDKPVKKDTLLSLFEAARWAASCFNEQPWRFIVGLKGDDNYSRILNVLGEFNQNWAKISPVLVLTISKKTFTKGGKQNKHSWYDAGQSMANLAIQATSLNLNVHQMAGFDKDMAEKIIVKDTDFEAISVSAIGYRGDPDQLNDDLKQGELAPQTRKPIAELVNFS